MKPARRKETSKDRRYINEKQSNQFALPQQGDQSATQDPLNTKIRQNTKKYPRSE